jgi:hypothetical protein
VFIPQLAKVLDDDIARAGHITVFANLLQATRLVGEAREGWATWSKKTKAYVSSHCLVRSKLVEMGLSLITMFSGNNLRSTNDPVAFEAAMKRAAPDATLPPIRSVA